MNETCCPLTMIGNSSGTVGVCAKNCAFFSINTEGEYTCLLAEYFKAKCWEVHEMRERVTLLGLICGFFRWINPHKE